MKLVVFDVKKGIESPSHPKWVFVAGSWLAESMHTSYLFLLMASI